MSDTNVIYVPTPVSEIDLSTSKSVDFLHKDVIISWWYDKTIDSFIGGDDELDIPRAECKFTHWLKPVPVDEYIKSLQPTPQPDVEKAAEDIFRAGFSMGLYNKYDSERMKDCIADILKMYSLQSLAKEWSSTYREALEKILDLCAGNESSVELVGKIEKIADEVLTDKW